MSNSTVGDIPLVSTITVNPGRMRSCPAVTDVTRTRLCHYSRLCREVSDMSGQNPLAAPSDRPAGLFLEPVMRLAPEPVRAVSHHPQPAPEEHLCTCGRIREACVHDEVRALWSEAG